MLSKEELKKKWSIALAQYTTIDKNKCQHFGTLVQGFLGIKKKGDNINLIPFSFYDASTLKKIEELVERQETDFLGISFVQYYIHYN